MNCVLSIINISPTSKQTVNSLQIKLLSSNHSIRSGFSVKQISINSLNERFPNSTPYFLSMNLKSTINSEQQSFEDT